jgi:hypothetical protein
MLGALVYQVKAMPISRVVLFLGGVVVVFLRYRLRSSELKPNSGDLDGWQQCLYVVFSLEATSWRPQSCSGGCRMVSMLEQSPSSSSCSDSVVSRSEALGCSSCRATWWRIPSVR